MSFVSGGSESSTSRLRLSRGKASGTRAAAAQKENVDPSSASSEENFSVSYENEEDEDLHHVKGKENERRQRGSRRTRRADAGAPPTSEQYGIPSTRRPLPRFVLRAEKKEKPPPREVHYDGLFVFYKDIEDKDEAKRQQELARQRQVQALAAASAEFEAARGEAHQAVHNLQKAVRVTARISALPKDERPEALQKLEEHAIAQEKAFQQEQKAEEALEQERASLRQFCVAEVVSSTKAEHAQHTHVPHDTFRRKARIAAMTRIMTRKSTATKSSGALSPGSPSVGQQSTSGAEASREKESTLGHAAHEGAAGAGEADVSQLLQMRKTKQHSAEDVNADAAGGPAQRVGEGSGIYDHVEEGEDHGAALRSSSAGYGGQHPFAFRDGLDANLTRLNLSAYPIQQARLGKHNHLKTGGRTSGVMIGTSGTGRSRRGSARAPSPFEQLFFGPGGRPPSSGPTPGSNMMLLGPFDILPDQQFGLGSSPSLAEAEAARGGGVLGEAAAPAPAQQVYPTPTISEQLMGGGRLNVPTSPSFYVPDQRAGEVSPRDRVKALRGGLFGTGTKAGGQEHERAGGALHGQARHEGSIDQLQALATPTSPSFMPPVDQRSGLHVHVQPLHAHGASPRSVQVEAGHLAGISRVAASQLKKIKSGSSSGSGSRSPVPSEDSGLLSDQEKLEMLRQKKAALIAAAQVEQAAVGNQLPQHRTDGEQHGEVAHPHVGSQHHDAVDPTQKIKLDGRYAREQRMVSRPGSAKERQKAAPVPHVDPELKQKLALPPTLQTNHSVVAASGRESRGQDHTVPPAEDVAKQNLLLNHPPPEKNKKKRDRSRSRSAAAGDNDKDKVDKRAHRVTAQERMKALHDRTNRVHQQDAIGFHGAGAIPAFHVAAAKSGSHPTSAKDPEERKFYTAHERAQDLPKTSDEEAAHGDPHAAPDAEKKRSPSAHDGHVTRGVKGVAAAATSAVKQVLGSSAAAAHEYLFGGRGGETQTPQTRSSAAEKVLHPPAGHDQQNDAELQELLEIEQMEKRLRDQNVRLRETLEHTQKDVKQDWDVLKTALKAEDAVAEVEHEKSVAEVQKLSEEAKKMAEATKEKWEAAEKELVRSASAGGVGVGGRRRRARVTSKAADRGDGGSSASWSSRASSRKRRNRNRKKLKLGKNIAIEHGGDAEVSRLEAAGVADSVGGKVDAAADAKGKDASATAVGGATLADGRAPGVEAAGDLDASDSIDSPHLLGPRPAGTKPMNLDELKQAAAKRTAKKKARRARSRSRSGSRRRKRGRSDPIKRGGTISPCPAAGVRRKRSHSNKRPGLFEDGVVDEDEEDDEIEVRDLRGQFTKSTPTSARRAAVPAKRESSDFAVAMALRDQRDGLLTPAAARFVVQRLHQEHEAEAAIIRREIAEIEEKMLSKLQPTGSKAFDVMLKHDVEFLPADNDTTTKVLAELKLGNPYVAQNFESGFVNLLGKEVAVELETEAGGQRGKPDAEESADERTQAQTNSPAAGGPLGRTSGMSMEEEMLEELRTTGTITTRHDVTKFYQEPRTSASSRPANLGPEEEQLLESYRTARESLTKARKTLMALAGTPNAGKVFQQISEMKKRERQLKQDEEHLLKALKLATTVAYAEERWQDLLNDPNNDGARQFDGKLALYVEEVGFLKEELARLQEAKHLADSELNVVRLSSPGSTSGLSAAERDWQAESDRLGKKIAVVEEEKGKLEEKMLAHANPGMQEPRGEGGAGSSSTEEDVDKENVDADRDHDANPRDPKSPISMEAKKEIAAAFRDMVEAGTLREQVLADTENSGLRKELLAGLHFTDAERWFIEEKLSAHNVAAAAASTGAGGEVDPITVVNAVARKKERMLTELLGHVRADLREVGEAKEQSRQELEAMGITEKSFANALMHMQLDGRKVKTLLDELAERGVSEEDVDGWMALAGAAREGGEVAEFERGVADGDVWTALQTASGTRNKNETEDHQQIPAVVPFVPDTTPPAARVQDRYTPPDQVTQVLSFDGKPKTDAAGRRFVYEPGTLRSFYLEREPVFHIKTLAGQLLQLGGPPWKYKVWEVVQLAPIEMLGGGRGKRERRPSRTYQRGHSNIGEHPRKQFRTTRTPLGSGTRRSAPSGQGHFGFGAKNEQRGNIRTRPAVEHRAVRRAGRKEDDGGDWQWIRIDNFEQR
eukprot:g700.t1